MPLKDKVVIVSGIGPGLGVKLAVEAAREGARAVVASARTAEKLDDAENRIRALGTTCRVLKVPTDITDAAQCRAVAERAVKEFGRIDGLVNSAYFHGDSVCCPSLISPPGPRCWIPTCWARSA